MKQQRGQAFILVLILLAVGALVIVPVLDYTTTGLRAQQISEDTMAEQCVADSSVEDALWKLLNELDLNNPATNYWLYGANIDIQIPRIAASGWWRDAEIWVKVDIEPNWLGPTDEEGTTYVIRICMPKWELTSIVLPLPEGLTYNPDTSYYKGPDLFQDLDPDAEVNIYDSTVRWGAGDPPPFIPMIKTEEEPTITDEDGSAWEEGKQVVEWPLSFEEGGRKTFILTCQVEGDPGWGIHYVQPQLESSKGWIKETDKTAALGSGIYNIKIDYQGVTYLVVVAYDSTIEPGGFEIISYQIVE